MSAPGAGARPAAGRPPSRLWRQGADASLTALLFSVVLLLFLPPFLGGRALAMDVVELIVGLVLVSATAAIMDRPALRWVAAAFLVSAVAAAVALRAHPASGVLAWYGWSVVGVLVVVTGEVVRQVLRPGRITGHRLRGAVSAYLLIGVTFSFLYSLETLREPAAFAGVEAGLPTGDERAALSRRRESLLYFSFVTLTTLGYGDITPQSALARNLAVVEALLGQLYVAILIARLVSLQIAHVPDRDGS